MPYRKDDDLGFLENVKSEELNDLVHVLTHDKNGDTRLTELLTVSEKYKKHYPDHHEYWDLIAAELQFFGANTFASILRGGKGVKYEEILVDVCDKLKVNYNKKSSTERIEENLLMKILADALENMSEKELNDLAQAIGVKNTSGITAQTMTGAFQAIFKAGGFKSYQLTLIVVNAALKVLIGRGLSFAGNAALTRTMALLTGPIGWVITGLWTTIDVAGPAYRVTIPATIQVAVLRKKQLYETQADGLELA